MLSNPKNSVTLGESAHYKGSGNHRREYWDVWIMGFPLCSFVPSVVEVLGVPITRDYGDLPAPSPLFRPHSTPDDPIRPHAEGASAEGRNAFGFWLKANGCFFKDLSCNTHPEALPDYSYFLRPYQLRIGTWTRHNGTAGGCSCRASFLTARFNISLYGSRSSNRDSLGARGSLG
jgi:hypothetical protein